MFYTFTINEKAIGKQRARKGVHGFYTPKETRDFQEIVQWEAKAAGVREIQGAVGLYITAIYKPPKSWSKEETQMAIETPTFKITKPDFDNIEKMIADSLNGIAYHDDAQVCLSNFEKIYGEEDRIDVIIQDLAD